MCPLMFLPAGRRHQPAMRYTLGDMQRDREMEFGTLQSIVGKLVDVRFLVPGGKFNMLFFLQSVQEEREQAPKEGPQPKEKTEE